MRERGRACAPVNKLRSSTIRSLTCDRNKTNNRLVQYAFALEVRRVFNSKQARSQKVAVKRKETGARRENTFLFSRATVSSRPNPSRRSRPNFVSSVLLSSVISLEKRERNGLQAVFSALFPDFRSEKKIA